MISRTRSASASGLRVLVAITVVLLVSLCSACYPIPLCSDCYEVVQRNDLLGTWEARDGDKVAQLRLHGDGTLELENVPSETVFRDDGTDDLDWTDVVNADGRWSFTEASSEPFSQGSIFATVRRGDAASSLSLNPQSNRLDLYYGDVELGLHLKFTKVNGPATPLPATLQRNELLGTWTSQGAGQLRLMRDGSFSITTIPVAALRGWVIPNQRDGVTDLRGRWMFAEEPLPLSDTAAVMLNFDPEFRSRDGSFFTWHPSLKNTDGGLSLQLDSLELRWELEEK